MSKLLILYILQVLISLRITAQINQVTIGQHVPDLKIRTIHNNALASLSSYKGKFLLLDFWGTYCVSCIENISHIEKIQQKYGKQLQILMVTEQPDSMIRHFLLRRKQMTNDDLTVPIIADDTVFDKIFVHVGLPHYVWIDQNGIVKYETFADVVNDSNIEAAINGRKLQFEGKFSNYVQVNLKNPLYIDRNGGDGSKILYYSVISKADRGTPSISGVFNSGIEHSYSIGFCATIENLFQIAYNDFKNQYWLPNNRTVFRGMDTTKYVGYYKGVIQWENFYNYQLIMPSKSYAEMQRFMQQDLQRYFNIESQILPVESLCWVLTCTDTNKIISKTGNHVDTWDNSEYRLTMNNVTIREMQTRFIYNIFELSPYPFVDETHIQGNIDLVLDNLIENDVNAIQNAVQKCGLKLTLENRTINKLFLNEVAGPY